MTTHLHIVIHTKYSTFESVLVKNREYHGLVHDHFINYQFAYQY